MTPQTPSAADPQAVAHTNAGVLQGIYEDGVRVFRGVPFAQPPIGELRLRRPRPLEPWEGVRDAHTATPAAAQFNSVNRERVSELIAQMDPGAPGIIAWPDYAWTGYDEPIVSEDCLYLDIWAPIAQTSNPLPVYLYYHGGANTASSASFVGERGANLARETNAVVVRPDYRLGALGWVHFGLITDELSEAVNLGFQDQAAALEWVHDNISAFGGDPQNITIGGESAGATAVSQLLTNPRTRRYVRRAVMQSLSPFNNWCTQQRPDAEAVARLYCTLLGISDPKDIASVEVERLIAAQGILTRWLPADSNAAWRPLGAVVDGDWIPALPAQYLSTQTGDLDGVEVIIGVAKDEWQFFRGQSETIRHGTKEQAIAVLTTVFGDDAAGLYASYCDLYPPRTPPGQILSTVMSFEFFKMSSLAIALNLSSQGVPTWMFQFSWDLPGLEGQLRALHTGDIPFLWQNYTPEDLKRVPTFDGIDRARVGYVSRTMAQFYGHFIQAGDPGPAWTRFTEDDWNVLWFGDTVEVRPGLLKDEWCLFTNTAVKDLGALEDALVVNVRAALEEANVALLQNRG